MFFSCSCTESSSNNREGKDGRTYALEPEYPVVEDGSLFIFRCEYQGDLKEIGYDEILNCLLKECITGCVQSVGRKEFKKFDLTRSPIAELLLRAQLRGLI